METEGIAGLYEGKANGPARNMDKVPDRSSYSRRADILNRRELEEVKMHGIKWYHWAMIGAGSLAMFFAVVIAIWFGFYRGEVASYGDPTKVYFKALDGSKENVVGVEGQKLWFCLDDIVWKQICPSKLITNLTPAMGPRLDLPTRTIDHPVKADRVIPKCRRWEVPEMSDDQGPGVAVMSGYMRSECTPLDHWYPIITPMPSAKFNWVRRTP